MGRSGPISFGIVCSSCVRIEEVEKRKSEARAIASKEVSNALSAEKLAVEGRAPKS